MTNKSQTNGLVSVIVTTYYRNDVLERALEHIDRQTYEPIEVIVVDDSGDRHAEPVVTDRSEVMYVVHEENRGQIAAWHSGFETANGEYVQLHDDDDWLVAEKIERQVSVLEASDASVAYCGIRHEGVNCPDFIPEHEGNVLREAAGPYHLGQTTTLLIRTEILHDVFPLKEYRGATDIAVNIELAKRCRFRAVSGPLVVHNISPDGKGSSLSAWQARLEIIRDYDYVYDEIGRHLQYRLLAKTHYNMAQKQVPNQLLNVIENLFTATFYFCLAIMIEISSTVLFRQ
jgi:glycosyltransferase involved in cell wall biosynthesis